jgi:transcriptional regulator with XRE-family HTH domain
MEQQLKAAREAEGLTQKEAAARLGLTRGRWAQMEAGEVVNLKRLLSACAAVRADFSAAISRQTSENV